MDSLIKLLNNIGHAWREMSACQLAMVGVTRAERGMATQHVTPWSDQIRVCMLCRHYLDRSRGAVLLRSTRRWDYTGGYRPAEKESNEEAM